MTDEKKFEVHAEITARLTQQDVDDIMVSALEGGINYWCRRVVVQGKYLGEYASDEKKFEVHAEITARLTQKDVDDIMVSALEGGINYWCRRVVVQGKYLGKYASDQISRGGQLAVWLEEPFEDDKTCYMLDLDKFLAGFKQWLENCYRLARRTV